MRGVSWKVLPSTPPTGTSPAPVTGSILWPQGDGDYDTLAPGGGDYDTLTPGGGDYDTLAPGGRKLRHFDPRGTETTTPYDGTL